MDEVGEKSGWFPGRSIVYKPKEEPKSKTNLSRAIRPASAVDPKNTRFPVSTGRVLQRRP